MLRLIFQHFNKRYPVKTALQEIFKSCRSVFFLQDLALNLAYANLVIKIILCVSCKSIARNFKYVQEKVDFCAGPQLRYMQDIMQDLESLARNILARIAYFLQDDFTGYIVL